jgi:membrane fusion protein (multidrug efflux system)
MDPIRVVFSVSDRTIMNLLAAAGGLSKDQLGQQFTMGLRLSNGDQYGQPGEIEYFDNEIDAQTGTIAIRAQFPNSQSLLIPGQFVTVVAKDVKETLRPVVPVGSVQQDRDGKFVFIVDDTSRVAMRRISVSEQSGRNWIVADGLKGGERLIVEGIQNAPQGSVVKATDVGSAPEGGSSAMPASSGTKP